MNFNVSCSGFSVSDQLIFRSLLRLLAGSTRHRWTYAPDLLKSDLVIHGPGVPSAESELEANDTALHAYAADLVRPSLTRFRLELQLPLRAASLATLLDSVGKRLGERQLDRLPLRSGLSSTIGELNRLGKGSLAASPMLCIGSAIRIGFLRFHNRPFWAMSEPIDLREIIGEVRSGSAAELRPSEPLKTLSPQGPLDELVWSLASADPIAMPLFARDGGAAFSLTAWPPINPRCSPAIHLKIVAAMSRQSLRYDELLDSFDGAKDDIIRVINAGMHCGLIRVTASNWEPVAKSNIGILLDPIITRVPRKSPWIVQMLRHAIGAN